MAMNEFYSKRRERFVNEEPARQCRQYLNESIQETEEDLATRTSEEGFSTSTAWFRWNWNVASDRLHLLCLDYSEGKPVEELIDQLKITLGYVENATLPHPEYRTEPFYLDETDTYDFFLKHISLAKLLHQEDLLPRYVALLDVKADENRGIDELYETLFEKLGLPSVPTQKHLPHKAHDILLEVIHAKPEKRPSLMKDFLKKWYGTMKGCYWYGGHEKHPENFVGYWCFESGLVTYLWDIDDSSYRDMPFYPKDLVDWARTPKAKENRELITSVHGGNPCTRTGWWMSPSDTEPKRYFKEGDIMPVISSAYGLTIWQWLSDE